MTDTVLTGYDRFPNDSYYEYIEVINKYYNINNEFNHVNVNYTADIPESIISYLYLPDIRSFVSYIKEMKSISLEFWWHEDKDKSDQIIINTKSISFNNINIIIFFIHEIRKPINPNNEYFNVTILDLNRGIFVPCEEFKHYIPSNYYYLEPIQGRTWSHMPEYLDVFFSSAPSLGELPSVGHTYIKYVNKV